MYSASDYVTMETDDDDSSRDQSEEDEEKMFVDVLKGYRPEHLTLDNQESEEQDAVERKKKKRSDDPAALEVLRKQTPELQHGYRILLDLMGDRCKTFAWPFIERVDPVLLNLPDYEERITNPMWLARVEEKFERLEYTSIAQFVSDVRLILANCYRYNGLKHMVSRQAQTLECHFEQKLGQLPRHVRDKTYYLGTLAPTEDEEPDISSTGRRRYSQRIMENKATMTPVATSMVKELEREAEERKKMEKIRKQEERTRLNQRLVEWEKEELLAGPIGEQLRAMWEIPALGQFLKLCAEAMFLPDFSVCELERGLVLPQSSALIHRIFTNVLTTRYHRKRISKKPSMPYEFWQDKLRKKFDIWFGYLQVEGATIESVARALYIPQRFFEVLGKVNPLQGRQYHDLSLYERVWVLKGLFDHLFETDYDIWTGVDTTPVEDQRPVVLGEDEERYTYLYFPHMLTDLRIYRQAQIKEEKEKTKKKKEKEKDASPVKRGRKGKSGAEPETDTPSQADDGVKRGRGRPRKTDASQSEKETGNSSQDEDSVKPGGRPKINEPKTENKVRGRPRKVQRAGETGTPSQPPAPRKDGRGRPRKDGTTPQSHKAQAKPTAIVTPVRRSSRMAARKSLADEEDVEKEVDSRSESGESSGNEKEEKANDSQNEKGTGVETTAADAMESEEKDKISLGTESSETCSAMDVCDSGAVGTESGNRTETSKTISTVDECAARTDDEDRTVNDVTKDGLDSDSVQNGAASKNMENTQEHISTTKLQSDLDEKIYQNIQEEDASCDVIGKSPSNDVMEEPPAKHVLCNGVMEGDPMDVDGHSKHSSDDNKGLDANQKTLIVASALGPHEKAVTSQIDGAESVPKIEICSEKKSDMSIQKEDSKDGGTECPNTNQSNNVEIPGSEVVRRVAGDEVERDGNLKMRIASDLEPKLEEKEEEEEEKVAADEEKKVSDNTEADGKDSISGDVDQVKEEQVKGEKNLKTEETTNAEVKDEKMETEDAIKEEVTDERVKTEEAEIKDEIDSSIKTERKTEATESGTLGEDKDGAKEEKQLGDCVEIVERPPTPPLEPTPGLSPPLGEFEMVCDSVESFKVLVEKFAQKEETVNIGRKSVTIPVKRPHRVVDLHKALTEMVEEMEEAEARLLKVIHKARERVFNEWEAYKKDPSPDQAAAAFWYEIKAPVQPQQPDASSVEDGLSGSEYSSEAESEKLSEEDDSEDEPDDDDDDEDVSSSDFSEPYPREEYDAASAGGEKSVIEGGEKNVEEGAAKGEKMDLYSGVEIAGRKMRSSKRRRAQKRDVVRAAKKAKRSKIQIVKGAPLPERYKRVENEVEEEEEEEDEDATIARVHAELKADLDAKAVKRGKRPIDKSSRTVHPLSNNTYSGVVQRPFNSQQKGAVQTYHKDESGKYIRLLKRTAGKGDQSVKRTAPQEPTLKVPFLEKTKKETQPVSSPSAADKKTKTETFSFTIDAKVWESLKDKPEERQKLIMEHVQKMRDAQKESPKKVKNSRHAPWFSRNTTQVSQPTNVGSQIMTQAPRGLSMVRPMTSATVQPQVVGVPQNNPNAHVAAAVPSVLAPTQVLGCTLGGQQQQIASSQVTTPGVLQQEMPVLNPISAQVIQSHQMATTIPSLTPAVTGLSQVNVAHVAGVPTQSLPTGSQLHVLQQPQALHQATSISSAGYSVSSLFPKEQMYVLLPTGQLVKNDGTVVKTRHFTETCKSASASTDSNQLQSRPMPSISGSGDAFGAKQAQNFVYIQPPNGQQHLTQGHAPAVTVPVATSRTGGQETTASPMHGCAAHCPTAATNSGIAGQQVHSSGMKSTVQPGQTYQVVQNAVQGVGQVISPTGSRIVAPSSTTSAVATGGTTGMSTSGVTTQANWILAAPQASPSIHTVQQSIAPTSVSIPFQAGTQVTPKAPVMSSTLVVQSAKQFTHGTQLPVTAPQNATQVLNTTTLAAQGTQVQLSAPSIQSTQQVHCIGAPSAPSPSQGNAVRVPGTAGAVASGSKTVILPTNLKVNCNNKQWKIVYAQKPGAAKPELCLQPCATDGSASGASHMIPLRQQQLQATNSGRNLSIQLKPQGNKIVMQAVGTPTTPTRAQTPQNIVVQNSLGTPQMVHVGAGNQGGSLPMMTSPVVQVAPTAQTVGASKAAGISPVGNHNTVLPAGTTTMMVNQNNAPTFSSGTASALTTNHAGPSNINNVIFQAASASGLVAPSSTLVVQAPQLPMNQITMQHAPQNNGQ